MRQPVSRLKNSVFDFISVYPKITGFAVMLGVLSLSLYLSRAEYQLRVSNEEKLVKSKLDELQNAVLISIRDGISATKTLGFLAQNIDVVENFDSIGRLLIENNPKIDAIQFLDSGTIVAVYPLDGNEAVIGYNVAKDPLRKEEIEESYKRKDVYFSGPLQLKQGGLGIVGRYPIFTKSGDLLGFSASIIRLETLIQNAGLINSSENPFAIQFSKTDPEKKILTSFLTTTDSISYSGPKAVVFLQEGNWELSVQLKDSAAFRQTLPGIILRCITAILFGIFAWSYALIPNVLRKKVINQSEDLKLANERFELATKATSDIIWDWDLTTNYTFRSANFLEIFGYSEDPSLANNAFWESIIHPEDVDLVSANLKEVLMGSGSYWAQEFRVKKQSGEYSYVLDKGYIIRDEHGKAIRMIGATKNITFRKLAELEIIQTNAKLTSANEELKAFASLASHDLREPLRMISSFMDLLDRKYSPSLDDKAKQYIHYAKDGAKRLTMMINDLLDYSKAGFDLSQLEKINLSELIREIVVLKSDIVRSSKATITFDQLPEIMSLKVPLKTLFQNLIGNALKYRSLERHPEIIIRSEEIKDFWKFTIEDNGIGIEAGALEDIFGIMKRLHSSEKYPGTGMGLATCRKIVTQFGGKIWAESTPGEGSKMIFTLKKV
jgi:PAS domain S-box-containing protein